MSLLTAFLREAWQQPPVVRSDVYIAVRTDGAGGSGTMDDPYNGAHYVGGLSTNSTRFDTILNDSIKVPNGTTVHLGPTDSADVNKQFLTRGFDITTQTTAGWKPRNGLRLVGAGMDRTRLKIVSPVATRATVAIGNDYGNDFLQGFEASDFTIDGALAQNDTSVGGVAISGKDILLLRLRVINFGIKGTGGPRCVGLSTARASAIGVPSNCVIDSCVLAQLYGNDSQNTLKCLHLGAEGSTSIHEACAIRNCYVEGNSSQLSQKIIGIGVDGAVGGIVEGNRVLNCQYGGPYMDSADATMAVCKDVIVRGNYLYNVKLGLYFTTGGGAGRIVTEENVIELAPSMADATGIRINGTATDAFNTFVARGNAIRPKDNDITTAQQRFGIKFAGCTNAVITDNVIDLGKKDANGENPADNAVFHENQQNGGKVTTFNNRKANGEFLAASTAGTAPHVWELTDEAENAVLGV